jgi:aspartate kinase
MPYLVQKFGGTSVATPAHMERAAKIVLSAKRRGYEVAVVVSAMAGETDRLLELTRSFSSSPDRREVDVVAATGESRSAALVALALQAQGAKARSLLGFQLPILTDTHATRARILSVERAPLLNCFENGEIPVLAGFQGIDEQGRITTLGRGGSDTTAVAVAAALGGALCEIYTDVDGVYTADPRLCEEASLLPRVSYRFMLEAAGLGAKVMHDKSVAFGMRHKVPIVVRSSFHESAGTHIGGQEARAACVTLSKNEEGAQVSLIGSCEGQAPAIAPDILSKLKDHDIDCRGLSARKLSVSFLVPRAREVDAVRLVHRFSSQYLREAL